MQRKQANRWTTAVAACVLALAGTARGAVNIGAAAIAGVGDIDTGGTLAPVLTFNGGTLVEGVDYTWQVIGTRSVPTTNHYADVADSVQGGSVEGFGSLVDVSLKNQDYGSYAGWFVGGNAANIGITGFSGNSTYGLYANGSTYAVRPNAEIVRSILHGDTLKTVSVDIGMMWDSDSSGSWKGVEFLDAGSNVVFGVQQGASETVEYYGKGGTTIGHWSTGYGTNAFTVTLTRTGSGYTVGGTTRTGGTVSGIAVTSGSAIAAFKAYMNWTDGEEKRQLYFDNLRYETVETIVSQTATPDYASVPGEYTAVFTGKGGYTGTVQRTFTVLERASIAGATVSGITGPYVENQFELSPGISINGTALVQGRDYTWKVLAERHGSATNHYADLASVSAGGSVEGFGDWEDVSSLHDGHAGWFTGTAAYQAGITGFTADTSYGLYANSGYAHYDYYSNIWVFPYGMPNAEVRRTIGHGGALTEIAVDIGLMWDSQYSNSFRGVEFQDGDREIIFGVNQGGNGKVNCYGKNGAVLGTWSEDYGTQVFTVRLTRRAGGYTAWGTTRTGEAVEGIEVAADADIAAFKAYMNWVDDSVGSVNMDKCQLYFDNLRYTTVVPRVWQEEAIDYLTEPGEYTAVFTGVGAYGGGTDRAFTVLEGPRPDFVPRWVSAPEAVNPGAAAAFEWAVGNEGTAGASGSWTEEVWLENESGRMLVAATNLTGTLAAGAEASRSLEVEMPAYPTVLGEVRAVVVANTDGGIREASTGLENNEARSGILTVGRTLGNGVELHAGKTGSNETWAAGTVHLVTADVTVPPGAALTIQPGAVVKFMDGTGLTVARGGTCTAAGVVFTHVADDTAGGDTMGDGGATVPEADKYRVTGAVKTDAATEMRWMTQHVSGTLSGANEWAGNRIYRVTANVTVLGGATLTVRPGAIVKFDPGTSLRVNAGGTLDARGTRSQPIVFTGVKDDANGGDTNGDGGASAPEPGDWGCVLVSGGAIRAEYCRFTYGGGVDGNQYGARACVFMWDDASGSFDGCWFGGSPMDGCFAQNASFRNCVFTDCDRGLVSHTGTIAAINCVAALNRIGFFSHTSPLVVRNSISSLNDGAPMDGDGGTREAHNCYFGDDPKFLDAEHGDFRIAEDSPCIDAGDGGAAPERDWWGQPRMDVATVADTGTPAANGTVPDIGIHEVLPRVVASDVDLAVTDVVCGAGTADIGGEIEVSWTVENLGTATAEAWRDEVELISENGAVAALGEKETLALPAGGRRTVTQVFAVPAMPVGAARARVRVNPQRDVFEGTLTANNTAVSDGEVEIRLPAWTAAEAGRVVLAAGGSAAYRIPAASGATALVLRGGGAGVAAYAAAGSVPGGLRYDAEAVALSDGSLLLSLPRDANGDCNIVLANDGREAVSVDIEAVTDEVALLEAAPGRFANTGAGYLTLAGVGMERVAGVRLEGAAEVVLGDVRAPSPAQLAGTADFSGVAPGTYAIVLELAGGARVRTALSVEVYKPKEGAKLEAWLEVPDSVREGRIHSGRIHYANTGDEDMPAPLLALDATGADVRLAGEEDWQEEPLYVMGISPADPAGVLRAGEESSLVFEFMPGPAPTFLLRMEEDATPGWAVRREALSEAATRVNRRGRPVVRWGRLELYAEVFASGTNAQAVSGRLLDESDGTPLAGARIAAFGSDGTELTGDTVDAEGRFVLEGLQGPTNVVLVGGGGAAVHSKRVEVPAAGDVGGLVWTGLRGYDVGIEFLGLEEAEGGGSGMVELVHDATGLFQSSVVEGGRAVVPVYCPGEYTATAVAGDGREMSKAFSVEGKDSGVFLSFDFSEGGSASGTVVDGQGRAVDGAVVTICSDTDPFFARAVPADGNGAWKAECLPAGDYVALASAPGAGAAAPVPFAVADHVETTGVAVGVVAWENSLSVTVDNAPEGGSALFTMDSGETSGVVALAGDGTCRFTRLPEGVGDIRIYDAEGNLATIEEDVLVKAGENARTVSVAAGKAVFVGIAADENGNPVAADWGLLSPEAGGVAAIPSEDDEEGKVALEVRKAAYWGQASAPGYVPQAFQVRMDRNREVSVVLKRGGCVGHTLPEGTDGRGATVAFSTGTTPADAVRGQNGLWVAGPLPAGETAVGFVVHPTGAYLTEGTVVGAGTTQIVAKAASGRPLDIQFGDSATVAKAELALKDGSGFAATFGVSKNRLVLGEFPAVETEIRAYAANGALVASATAGAADTGATVGTDSLVTIAGCVTGAKPGQCAGGMVSFCTAGGVPLARAALSASGAFRSASVPARFERVWIVLCDGTAFAYGKAEAAGLGWRLPMPSDLGEVNYRFTDNGGGALPGLPVIVTYGDGFRSTTTTDSNGRVNVKHGTEGTVRFEIAGTGETTPPQTPTRPSVCGTCGRHPCTCRVASPCPSCGADPCICRVENRQISPNGGDNGPRIEPDPVDLPPLKRRDFKEVHYHDWTLRESLWYDPLVADFESLCEQLGRITMSPPPRICGDSECKYCPGRFGAYNRAAWDRYQRFRTLEEQSRALIADELAELRRVSQLLHQQQAVGAAKIGSAVVITIASGGAAGGAAIAWAVGGAATGVALDYVYEELRVEAGGESTVDGPGIARNATLESIQAADAHYQDVLKAREAAGQLRKGAQTAGSKISIGDAAGYLEIALDGYDKGKDWRSGHDQMNRRIGAMEWNLAQFRSLISLKTSAAYTPYKICDIMCWRHCEYYGKCDCKKNSSPTLVHAVSTNGPASSSPTVPHAIDPNEMAGPAGVGEARLVKPGDPMDYTIYFENKPTATAAAQEIRVTAFLDPALDWSSFALGDVAFGGQLDNGLAGKRSGASEVAMEGTDYRVRSEAAFDAGTGKVTWYLRIVDPATGDRWPRDLYAGILPPNDETGSGEGHLTYQAKVREDAGEAAVIRASASIVFDNNPAIETDPAWWNTVTRAKVQEITFPEIGPQVATNTVELWATASSGLPVSYAVEGPAVLDGDMLAFTGAGTVTVTVRQDGEGDWQAAEPVERTFEVSKAVAEVRLTGLAQSYDGTAKEVGVETVPAGLPVAVAYDGVAAAPSSVGSHAVSVTVTDAIWEGSAEGVLEIAKGRQAIAFAPIGAQVATGTVMLEATASSGLDVSYAVSGPAVLGGNALTFTGAGTVTVTASQAGDGNWEAAENVVRAFDVSKAIATVTLGGLVHTYDGGAKMASVTTVPEGLDVVVTYDNGESPRTVGSYGVIAAVIDDRWEGRAEGTLVISKGSQSIEFGTIGPQVATNTVVLAATASSGLAVNYMVSGPAVLSGNVLTFTESGTVTVTASQSGDLNWEAAEDVVRSVEVSKAVAEVMLDNLNQTYNGEAREVTVTTVPDGLAVSVTYEGVADAPIAVGSYAIEVTVADAIWSGSASGTLEIAKGSQSIDFAEIGPQVATNAVALDASSSSGLAVSYVVSGPAVLDGNELTFTGAGMVTVTASQGGDSNWEVAEEVERSFEVSKAVAEVTLGGLSQTYDGKVKTVTVATVPDGLIVSVAYDGVAEAPAAAGNYTVEATVEDAIWSGSASGTLEIAKGSQSIDFAEIPAQVATNTVVLDSTASSGLAVSYVVSGPVELDGNVLSFTGAGTVTVTASQGGDSNWEAAEEVERSFEVSKAVAEVTLGGLDQTYDGEAKTVTVTTVPDGLDVSVTYNGVTQAPSAAGSYVVEVTVEDAIWSGSASGTLEIAKRLQSIDFAEIGPQVATNTVVLEATASSGLAVDYAVSGPAVLDGNVLAFTGAGTVTVTASQGGDSNWDAAEDVARSFGVSKAVAEVTLGSLNQAYDGAAKTVTVTTVPDGLAVSVTYNGVAEAPITADNYAVEATVEDAIWSGNASGTLEIAKGTQSIDFAAIPPQVATNALVLEATASSGLAVGYAVSGPAVLDGNVLAFTGAGTVTVTASQGGDSNWDAAEDVARSFEVSKAVAEVTLGGLNQAYDGAAKTVTVTTVPDGLAVSVTYDGVAEAPTAAGSYAVEATVEDAIWSGSASGTLEIAKGMQSIDFAAIPPQVATNTLALDATASSGLAVGYAISGPAVLDGNVLAFTGAGTVTVTASQGGDINWDAAEDVARSFEVSKAVAEVTLGGLSQTYDGEAKTVTVTTVPDGLAVAVTYDGVAEAPIAAGSYAVEAMVEDAIWSGSATGTLEIAKGSQSIDFSEIGPQVATNTVVLDATAGSGLAVDYAVNGPAVLDGNVLAFTGAGMVTVTASQGGDANWDAAEDVVRSFDVSKAVAEVTLGGLSRTYDGEAKTVTVTTVPDGLTVSVTYDGGAEAPIAAGSYAVEATVEDAIWSGSASGTLEITPADPLPPVSDDSEVAAVLEGAADAGLAGHIRTVAEYNAFREWALGVKGSDDEPAGTAVVMASEHAWASYLLGAEVLFANKPDIRISGFTVDGAPTGGADGEPVSITATIRARVKDGADEATVDPEKVAALLAATGDVSDWSDGGRFKPMVLSAGTDGDGTLIFHVGVGSNTVPDTFFAIRE